MLYLQMCKGISSSANRLLIITSLRINLRGPLLIGTNTPVARATSSAISVDSPLLLLLLFPDDGAEDGIEGYDDDEDRWCCGYPWFVIRLCSCRRAEACEPPNFMKNVGVASASSSASSASLEGEGEEAWATGSVTSSSSALAISASWSPWREAEA